MLAYASAYLGADSGVSHLAASVGAPAVILYPPATRDRWAPWSSTAVALTTDGQGVDETTRVAEAVIERLRAARGPLARAGP